MQDNGSRDELILVFDSEQPHGYVAGIQAVYRYGETETIAKGLSEVQPGDTLEGKTRAASSFIASHSLERSASRVSGSSFSMRPAYHRAADDLRHNGLYIIIGADDHRQVIDQAVVEDDDLGFLPYRPHNIVKPLEIQPLLPYTQYIKLQGKGATICQRQKGTATSAARSLARPR